MKLDSVLFNSNYAQQFNITSLINKVLLKQKQYKSDIMQIKERLTNEDNRLIKLKYKIKDFTIENHPLNDEIIKLKSNSEETSKKTKDFENDLKEIETQIFELSNLIKDKREEKQETELYLKIDKLEDKYHLISKKYDTLLKRNQSLSLSVEWVEKQSNNSITKSKDPQKRTPRNGT